MKKLFCEECNELTEQTVCPKCGKPTREPKCDDMCFVCVLSGIDADMYTDALNNNEIKFVNVPSFSMNGANWDNKPSIYMFYVGFADYDKAAELFDVLFSQTDEPIKNEDWIDCIVKVTIDRPYGSVHPKHPDIKYELNYGYVEGVVGGDGEWQDAYNIDYKAPMYVGQEVSGYVVAVIIRKDDNETKWVVDMGSNKQFTKEQIAQAVNFQEKFFDIEIIM